MSNDISALLIAFAALVIGFLIGWSSAHDEVARECKRQGSFYVGETDFMCRVVPKEHP